MVCISELRGLQEFQAKHPEAVVVALNVLDEPNAPKAIENLIDRQNIHSLRIANGGKDWQTQFGLSEQIPVTLVIQGGKVRIEHDGVMPDPLSYLDADLAAILNSSAVQH